MWKVQIPPVVEAAVLQFQERWQLADLSLSCFFFFCCKAISRIISSCGELGLFLRSLSTILRFWWLHLYWPSSSAPPAASCASWGRGGGGCPRASLPGCWSSSPESDGSLAPAINMVYKQILPNNHWQAYRTCTGVSLWDFCKVADRQLRDRTVLLGLFNCKQMVSK